MHALTAVPIQYVSIIGTNVASKKHITSNKMSMFVFKHMVISTNFTSKAVVLNELSAFCVHITIFILHRVKITTI